MSATYLYAILAGEPQLDLRPIGLPDGSAPVFTVAAGSVSALVGEYHGPDPAGVTREEQLRLLLVHQQVLEEVIGQHALLPVRFGTILSSTDEVKGALERFRPRLQAALDDVGNSIEVDLSASWDTLAVATAIGRTPEIVAATGVLEGLPEPAALAARMRIGQLVQEKVDQQREQYRRRVVGGLTRLVRDAQPNPRPTDDIVLNVAFLVEREGIAEFDDAVDRLGEEFEGQMRLRYVGPLPPYSFGTVLLTRPIPVVVRAARELLGLGESVTPEELQRAYRQQAARLHPDVNRDDPLAGESFAQLKDAHDEIAAYLQGTRSDPGDVDGDTRYDLSEGAVQAALLLDIRREQSQVGEAQGAQA